MIIEINTLSPSPIYEQLRDQVVLGIASKKLSPGESLPSVRRLAADLGINFHTVNKAYTMLCDEGYIVMDRRKGAVIAQNLCSRDDFESKFSKGLLLAAAEAACHQISESDFINFCSKSYRNALSGAVNGGI